jgi:hypothetical protein
VTFSQPLPTAFSGRQMMVFRGRTSATASFLPGKTFGHWQWIPETMPMRELLVAQYFAASDPLSPCGSFRDRGLGQRQPPYLSVVDYNKRNTRAPRWFIPGELSARRVISSTGVRISGTRDHSRVPEENDS